MVLPRRPTRAPARGGWWRQHHEGRRGSGGGGPLRVRHQHRGADEPRHHDQRAGTGRRAGGVVHAPACGANRRRRVPADSCDGLAGEGVRRHQDCRRCTIDCPPQAISDTKALVRGARKWYVDFDRCVPYFAETGGCAICIEVCPRSEPGRGLNVSLAALAKRARIAGSRSDLSPGEVRSFAEGHE